MCTFYHSGPARITCGADGEWSQAPTCEQSTCPPYPISTSNCTKRYRLVGTMYYLHCVEETEDVSVTRTGSSSALCYNNEWTDDTMACYCDCKVHADPDKVTLDNVNQNGFLLHGRILSWNCRNGGTKASNADLECIDGVMDDPSCVMPTTTSTTTERTTTSTTTAATTTMHPPAATTTHAPATTTMRAPATTSTASSVFVPFSTSSTNSVTATVSKIVDLLTGSTTQPALPTFPVCSCDCATQEDNGIADMFQNDKNLQLEPEWTCTKRSAEE